VPVNCHIYKFCLKLGVKDTNVGQDINEKCSHKDKFNIDVAVNFQFSDDLLVLSLKSSRFIMMAS